MIKPAIRRFFCRGGFMMVALFFWIVPMKVALSEDIYVFQDAEGTLHYATLSRIPPAYRKHASLYLKEHKSYTGVRRRLSRREASILVFPKNRLLKDYRPLSPKKFTLEPKTPRGGEDLYDGIILAASRAYGIDFYLLKAIIRAESNFNPAAVSPKGACGLMQLMPSTAQELGVQDVFNPEENIHGGARYLRWLYETFEGDWPKTLAAYNAGPGRVGSGGIPYIQETQEYLRRVSDFYRFYRKSLNLRVVLE